MGCSNTKQSLLNERKPSICCDQDGTEELGYFDPPTPKSVDILVLGDSGVGKTSLINIFIYKEPSPTNISYTSPKLNPNPKWKRYRYGERVIDIFFWDININTNQGYIFPSSYYGKISIYGEMK